MATLGPFKFPALTIAATLTGTLTETADEALIVTGGATLIITLTNATWLAAGTAFDAIRQDIIDGLDSAQAEATGWDAEVLPAIAVTDVARTSDTVVTITLPAVAAYDITADEEITATVPASATSHSAPIVATPTVTISAGLFDFLMLLTPIDFATSCTVSVNADFEVDWGSGTFTAYTAGNASAVPSGTITVRSANSPTLFSLVTDTFTACDVQTSSTLTSLNSSCAFKFALASFAIDDTSSVTDMTSAFRLCSALVSVPAMDTSAVTTMLRAWQGCTTLTSFPTLDTSACTNFSTAWSGCTGLTSFPTLDTSAGLTMFNAWADCTGLTAFPALSTASVTTMESAWVNCTGLTAFPTISLAACTTVRSAWEGCSGLTAFPALTMPSVTDIRDAWRDCTGLTAFPTISLASATLGNGAWFGCTALETFPAVSFAAMLDLGSAFEGCTVLETFPDTSFPVCTQFDRMFFGCSSLVQVGDLGTSAGTNFNSMFPSTSLRCINGLNTTASGATKTGMLSSNILKHPNPDELGLLISATGLDYTNGSTGDCAPWVCSNEYLSEYLEIDLSAEFGDESLIIQNVDTTGNADPLANITLAHTDTVLDFSTGMTFDAGNYSKTVGNLLYRIIFKATDTYTYSVTATTSDLETELGIFAKDQAACVAFV